MFHQRRMLNDLWLMLPDQLTKGLCATGSNTCQMLPLGVARVGMLKKVLYVVCNAVGKKQSIFARSAGFNPTGQSIDETFVPDIPEYRGRALEVNVAEIRVRDELRIVFAELNAHLKPYGMQFAPGPVTGNGASVGVIIADNLVGMGSAVYCMTINHGLV
jgi:FAD/FMN-containing dehydrogenase